MALTQSEVELKKQSKAHGKVTAHFFNSKNAFQKVVPIVLKAFSDFQPKVLIWSCGGRGVVGATWKPRLAH